MRLQLPTIATFQQAPVPPDTRLAGWAALVHDLSIQAPVRQPSCISDRHVRGSHREQGVWRVFDKRYWPGDSLADHLNFALRNERLDLLVLKRIFAVIDPSEIQELVHSAPTGAHARRIWFFYESMTGQLLDLPDAPNLAAVDLLDPAEYFTSKPVLSRRHRVRDNMLGTGRFSPIIRRTVALEAFIGRSLAEQARTTIGRTSNQLVSRAASFLLLADSRASFEIEGDRAPRTRLERWARATSQAGRNNLTLEEIIRLHHVLIEDTRFVQPGFRPDAVFLGERDHAGDPMPEFIGANPPDIPDLMQGCIAANDRMQSAHIDPVLQAAATSFGFVYIHPLQDGNGRVHRCLIHHVLAERDFTPFGMVFPVSFVMLDRIDDYRTALQAHTGPLMPFIDWHPTPDHNVEVTNDTTDLYRYFDCTDVAEFLYGCVLRTVEKDLPHEIDYLRRNDEAIRRIMDAVEMPDRLAENLVMFIRQNSGTLPNRRRQKEFQALTDAEVSALEDIVGHAFEGFPEPFEQDS
jgi:hypothetical protein